MFRNPLVPECQGWADHSRGDRATSVGERSNRNIVIAEIGESCKCSLFCPKVMVHAGVELVLAIGLNAGSDVVICRSGQIGKRITSQHLCGDRINAADRNLVSGKLRPPSGGWVVDRSREDSTPLCGCGHRADARNAGAQPGALPIDEEERLVFLNRTSEGE